MVDQSLEEVRVNNASRGDNTGREITECGCGGGNAVSEDLAWDPVLDGEEGVRLGSCPEAMSDAKCNGCRACCYAYELGTKPAWTWCKHVTASGCGCHDDQRPDVCKNFKCGYFYNNWPEALRPDRCGVIVAGRGAYKGRLVVACREVWRGAAEGGVGQWLIAFLRRSGVLVWLSTEEGAWLVGGLFGVLDLGYDADDYVAILEQLHGEAVAAQRLAASCGFEFARPGDVAVSSEAPATMDQAKDNEQRGETK